MASSAGGSVWVRSSLMTTKGTLGGGSSAPGEPPGFVLGRQFEGEAGSPATSVRTREKPYPSGVMGQGTALL
jgi:hypothetical protein